jgi:chromosome segregation ATPase
MASQKKTPPGLETVETLLNEVDEHYGRFSKIHRELGRLERGSEPYLNRLAELEVELFALKLKTQQAHEALDEFEESLPEGEESAPSATEGDEPSEEG